MKMLRLAAIAAALIISSVDVQAAGLWPDLPQLGGASYCAGFITPSGVQGGITGQGGTPGTAPTYCQHLVPAGPNIAGTEFLPADVQGLGTVTGSPINTVAVTLNQLGQGLLADIASPATATIPVGTAFYMLDGAQGSAFTVTLPGPVGDGYIEEVGCTAATVGTLTVQGNAAAGQTVAIKPVWSAVACVAGTDYRFRYNASNTSWYRIQ